MSEAGGLFREGFLMSSHTTPAVAPSFVDFDGELRYWSSQYPDSPFFRPGLAYEDFEPAFKLGINVFLHGHGRSFEEQSGDLADAYNRTRGSSPLDWNEAKPAAAAAGRRMKEKLVTA